MQDLTPVGLSQDGRRLLLISPAGEEFAVPVDTRLRAALRGDNARLGQLEMKMESALRPRDIQARIRAGESAEDVAAAAGTTVDAIMGFAGPVIAERQHVAQTALKASVRRRSGESSSAGRTLGEAAELFFGDHKLHDEDVEWDAWRGPDGRWKLVANYAVAGRPRVAELSLDLPGQYVVAENDEARILTGELAEPESRQPAGGRTAPARRLSSVPSQDELPLGDDAIELVRDPQRTGDREPAADEPTDFAAAAEQVPAQALDPAADTADADWIADETAGPVDGPVDEPLEEPGESLPDGRADAGPGAEPDVEPTPELDEPAAESTPAPKRKSRSSVPSWDEIMFGGGKPE
ncbi:MAG: hypothetical protein JWR90_3080 [Marmoricola sp.]|jgi:hypothetical protein|nr:hypothetical protein [Marmoricola sp.]